MSMTTPEDAKPGKQGDAKQRPTPDQGPVSPFGGPAIKSWHAPHRDDPKRIKRASDGATLPVAPPPTATQHDPAYPSPKALHPEKNIRFTPPAAKPPRSCPHDPAPIDQVPPPEGIDLTDRTLTTDDSVAAATPRRPLRPTQKLPHTQPPLPPTRLAPLTMPSASPAMPPIRPQAAPAPRLAPPTPSAPTPNTPPSHPRPYARPRSTFGHGQLRPHQLPAPQPPIPATLAPPTLPPAIPPPTDMQTSNATTPPALGPAQPLSARKSLEFAFTTYSRNVKLFSLLGLTCFAIWLIPMIAEASAQWVLATSTTPARQHDLWPSVSYSIFIACQIGLMTVSAATFCAAHQLCGGHRPTLSSSFSKLPWVSTLACTSIAAVPFCLNLMIIDRYETLSPFGTSPLAQMYWHQWLSAFGTPATGDITTDRVIMIITVVCFQAVIITAAQLALAALLAPFFLYLLPAATSGADPGTRGLLRSPDVACRNLISTLALLTSCTFWLAIAAVFVLPLFLWAMPVCTIATTHAYRTGRGFPAPASQPQPNNKLTASPPNRPALSKVPH